MLQQAINIVVLGCMYSIVALGFTLYFGTINLINFAHGDFCALATFCFLLLVSVFGMQGPELSLAGFTAFALCSTVICALVGVASERLLFRHLRGRSPLEGLIVSLALSMMIREMILHLYPNGGNPQPFPDLFAQRGLTLGGLSVSWAQVTLVCMAIGISVVFFLVVHRTQFGRYVRAIAQDPEAAKMIGLPVDRIITKVFMLGAAFASVAGVMNGMLYGSVKFDMGISLGLKGFIAAVIGGLDNPSGALVGGLVLGIVETVVIAVVPRGSEYRDIIVYSFLILALLLRPSGLLALKSNGK